MVLQDVQKKEAKEGTFWNNEISVGRGVVCCFFLQFRVCVLMKSRCNEKKFFITKGFYLNKKGVYARGARLDAK